jgi:glycosyltransferase involved in cell wall biosynthesis
MKKTHAIIVPCYNEAKRLQVSKFVSFAQRNPEYTICFVNDGSKDNTLQIITDLQNSNPESIVAIDMPQNGGKANAVRYGMLYAAKNLSDVEFIGFLDADLATSLEEMRKIGTFIQRNDYFQLVVGSRIVRMGANIQRFGFRKIASKVIQQFIALILQLRFQDTQCGAKMFNKEMVELLFSEEFKTDWLFDVEVFLRVRKAFGKVYAQNHIYEFPLQSWVNAEGSKVTMKEILRTPFMLMKIAYNYNVSMSF